MSEMINRTEIAPGVILEKFHTVKKKKKYCVLKIEVQIFNALDFTIDFTGSTNIELKKKSNSLIEKTLVQPFTKTVVATVKLNTGWTLKTKYSFVKKMPAIELQKKHLAKIFSEIVNDINNCKALKGKDMENSDFKLIKKFCDEKNVIFCDPEFPPNYKSIGISEQQAIDSHECYIHWRKLKYIFLKMNEVDKIKTLPYIYENGVQPQDIKTGKFDISWLMSGIASLSERPYLIKRLILTKEANDVGIYTLKFQNFAFWKTVIIDSYFPCFPLGDPIFDHNHGNEFWVLLLEKGYAKIHGNYAVLSGGSCKEALFDLTGCPTFEISLPDDDSKENEKKEETKGLFEQVENKLNKEDLWTNMLKWNKYKYLLSVLTRELEIEDQVEGGNIKEQSYAILNLFEDEKKKIRLVNMRNIWNLLNWTGEWSSKSPLWTEEIKKKIKPNLEDPTQFWMSYDHFLENFGKLNICYTRSWEELKVRGKFIKTIDDENEKIIHWCSRWYYELKLDQTTKIVIGLHQEDERTVGVKETRRYIDIGIDIIQKIDDNYVLLDFYPSDFQREIFLEIWLKKGNYFVVPKSSGISLQFSNPFKKNISHFSTDNEIVLSVMKDIFRKFDIVFDNKLKYKEIVLLYEILGKNITELEFLEICEKYKKLTHEKVDYITEEGFVQLFAELLQHHDRENILEIFDKLGYNENLQSINMRLFTITIHSSIKVNLELKDALEDHADFITNRLELRKFGSIFSSKDDVEHYSLINKNTKCCYYGVYNKSLKSIKVSYDFSSAKNIASLVENNKIEKTLKSGDFEYILHIQIDPTKNGEFPIPIIETVFL